MGKKSGVNPISNNNDQENVRGSAGPIQRRRGRPPKPIDLHAALELTLFGSSFREYARQAGCSPRTLMGRHAEAIELAEARVCGFLRTRLWQLALEQDNASALLFLLRTFAYPETKPSRRGQRAAARSWTRPQFQQALRIVWRHASPKPKLRNTYRPFRAARCKKPPETLMSRPKSLGWEKI